jgi:hypothetical protein
LASKSGNADIRHSRRGGQSPQPERHDARALIVSLNVARRNLKKGQQATALAMIYPEPEKGGRRKNIAARKAVETSGFSPELLKHARAVLRHSRELAQDVLRDITPLDTALKKVKAEREYSSSIEARRDRLRKEAPDLAGLVDDERMSENEAIAALEERNRLGTQRVVSARQGPGVSLNPRPWRSTDPGPPAGVSLLLGLQLGLLRGKRSLHGLAEPLVHRDRLPARPGADDLLNRIIQKLKISKAGPASARHDRHQSSHEPRIYNAIR